jgi:aminoglycoside phosphotransferase (APT) family kinase protein
VRWVTECSESALREALRAVAPALSQLPVAMSDYPPSAKSDPLYWSSSAVVGDEFIAKFAWSEPAALRTAHEIGVLTALADDPAVPFLPEIVASGTDPVLLVTRRVAGASLFSIVDSIDRDLAGRQLARFLAALHQSATRHRVEDAVGRLDGPRQPPATTRTLRDQLGTWIGPEQTAAVMRWLDWTDAVLARPALAVLVHGDFHGNNVVWDGDQLRLVVDFELAGAAEPEYDLRTLPGPGMGPRLELLTAVMRHYQRLTGRELSAERVMAWNLRQNLSDVAWRSEAGLPLGDGRTPAQWVRDLAAHFRLLGIDPDR